MPDPSELPWARIYPASVDWNAPLPSQPLYRILDNAVRDYPDNVALDFLDKFYTYRELGDLVARAAKGLQDLGVVKGDRVGMFLPNTPYYVALYFAALKLGAIVVNFNPLYAEKEIEKQINDSGCKVMATVDVPSVYDTLVKMQGTTCLEKIIVGRMTDILPPVKSALYRLAKRREIARPVYGEQIIDFRTLTANDGNYKPAEINPENDLAVLQYTGGTTGPSKGAMLTHANLSANTEQSRLLLPGAVMGQETMLGVLPFFHVFAMTAVMNVSISLGGRIIMLPRFDLEQAIKTIHKKRPTLFPAVPAIYNAINHYKDLGRYNLRSVRFCISGGAPLPVAVKKQFETLTGCVVVEGYGLSETSPVATCNPVDGENRAGSIGLPVPGTHIEIVDPETRELLRLGAIGEICIRGPQVMKGYWNNPQETARVMETTPRGERLRTGDLGHMDPDGYVYVDDRMKDMIAVNGFKVYPSHVEEEIYRHPAVEECGVIGIPDESRGETVVACIRLRDGQSLTAGALREFLQDTLARWAMPKPEHILFWDQPLPKTTIGKLSRKDLRTMVAARLEAEQESRQNAAGRQERGRAAAAAFHPQP